ncbi:MAG: proline--tRNA ligase [Erysipelotrichia bacterium]|nr:proline--tRNA ligase [Erysipelotrichia bacterium]
MAKDNHIKNEAITRREDDFAQWYTDVCRKAELMDYSSVRGFIIYRPYGYAIWEEIQNYLNKKFKETGHQNVYMPTVIPESLLQKEKDHVAGFAPECLVATHGGGTKLEDPLIIRPTSETLFCEHYAKIISSYRDLPKLYNQWCSVVRWEKTTRPFLRGAEFLWQEGHTMHENEEEARTETLKMLEIYADLGRDLLAIPFTTGRKTDKEKFAGALETYAIEALMPDGKALQSGTTHYFGTGFAEVFNIRFQGRDGKVHHPHQTSWGVSTRLLGAIIMVHGDDNGLSLPPYVAPIQAVIIPIAQRKPEVIPAARSLETLLKNAEIRVKIDESDKTPGWKFSEYEMKGVPLRIEIGPRDIEKGVVTIVIRHDGRKLTVKKEEFVATVKMLIKQVQQEMYEKAHAFLLDHITDVTNMEEFNEVMAKGGYARAMWCGNQACEDKIKDLTTATARVLPFNQMPIGDTCLVCGQPAKKVVLFAKAY